MNPIHMTPPEFEAREARQNALDNDSTESVHVPRWHEHPAFRAAESASAMAGSEKVRWGYLTGFLIQVRRECLGFYLPPTAGTAILERAAELFQPLIAEAVAERGKWEAESKRLLEKTAEIKRLITEGKYENQ